MEDLVAPNAIVAGIAYDPVAMQEWFDREYDTEHGESGFEHDRLENDAYQQHGHDRWLE